MCDKNQQKIHNTFIITISSFEKNCFAALFAIVVGRNVDCCSVLEVVYNNDRTHDVDGINFIS
jgi:hypothetical protein